MSKDYDEWSDFIDESAQTRRDTQHTATQQLSGRRVPPNGSTRLVGYH